MENEKCKYCEALLSECAVQEHWERRLRAVNLNENRAGDSRIYHADGTRTERVVQMDRDLDFIPTRPAVVPINTEVAALFVADSLGIRLSAPSTERFWPNKETPNRSIEHKVTA